MPPSRSTVNTPAAQLRRRARVAILLAGVSGLSLSAAGTAQARLIGPPGANSAVANAAAMAQAAAAQAAAATAQVQKSLARATLAIQAGLAVQAAARNAATANNLGADPNHPGLTLPNVPDGLDTPDGRVIGGLRPDTGPAVAVGGGSFAVPSSWLGISALSQTASGGQTTVTLTQSQTAAVATWQTFNVGRNTTVHFDQTAGNSAAGNGWVVLNRVLDPSGVPSQILGQIKAEGTVLLINRNGIIFGGSSQVNVHSLIASSFDLGGITGQSVYDVNGNAVNYAVSNANFVANGLFIAYPNTPNNSVAFQSGSTLFGTSVTTQPGAIINSSVDGADNGGFVALIGPRVNNGGAVQVSAGDLILSSGVGVELGQPLAGTAITVQPLSTSNSAFAYVGQGNGGQDHPVRAAEQAEKVTEGRAENAARQGRHPSSRRQHLGAGHTMRPILKRARCRFGRRGP
jgi:filamentous hemagglutinin family protein